MRISREVLPGHIRRVSHRYSQQQSLLHLDSAFNHAVDKVTDWPRVNCYAGLPAIEAKWVDGSFARSGPSS
jgi:hypothetical protein